MFIMFKNYLYVIIQNILNLIYSYILYTMRYIEYLYRSAEVYFDLRGLVLFCCYLTLSVSSAWICYDFYFYLCVMNSKAISLFFLRGILS